MSVTDREKLEYFAHSSRFKKQNLEKHKSREEQQESEKYRNYSPQQ